MLSDVASPPGEPIGYDAIYRLRRSQSTMTTDAIRWMTGSVARWTQRRRTDAPLRILSLGCGDGTLDVPVLDAARSNGPIHYVGCDLDAASLAVFSTALASRVNDLDFCATLLHQPFETLEFDHRFDLVVLSHVLYYVEDPAATLRSVLDTHCALDGRLIVAHSGRNGIPAVVEAAWGTTPFVTAEQIVADLVASGLRPTTTVLPGRLCIDDAIEDTPQGRSLLEFLVERDDLGVIDRERLVSVMVHRSTEIDGGRWMSEDLVTLEIRNSLRAMVRHDQRITVDPLEDYPVLAESFDWAERLESLGGPGASSPSLLDVGCGTGRWLRVLASTFPELTARGRLEIVYDRVDPSVLALEQNAHVASTLFRIGSTWCEGIEHASIPFDHYALIWSMHSMYSLSGGTLDDVLARLARALTGDGTLMVALGDPGSFYCEAKPRLIGGEPFTTSADVVAAADRLGLPFSVATLRYVESFDASDEVLVRNYVWHESIGNSYLPAGLSNGLLPELPTGEWWETHRRGDRYVFEQSVSLIMIRRG